MGGVACTSSRSNPSTKGLLWLLWTLILAVQSISEQDLAPNILKFKYAVRGPIVARALELKKQLANGEGNLPFEEIIFCNIGNPQALGQKPITYYRQVLSGILNPGIMDSLPSDVQDRVKKTLDGTAGSIGAYTHSQGLEAIRKDVSEFILDRDGYPADPNDIFLTDGASSGVKALMSAFLHKPNHGVLIPIPQYPLYTATLSILGAQAVPYYLNEGGNWSLDMKSMRAALKKAKSEGIETVAVVIINPGNPTGNCLSEEDLIELVQFAEENNLMLMADEVYQRNVYNPDMMFVSAKRIVRDLNSTLPLVSFHSTSKGLIGECGLRGGYFELTNFPPVIRDHLYRLASVSLCPNTIGQVATSLMVKGPDAEGPSFALFKRERAQIYDALKRKANIVSKKLNEIQGVDCQNVDGALYAFPQITLPQGFMDAAKKAAMEPDTFFCMNLLEKTGIVTVSGSGFAQVEGTYHLRLTILPPEDKIPAMLRRFEQFFQTFVLGFDSEEKLEL